MMVFAPEPGEYDGQPVPQEPGPRYVLRAMTLEDAHKQGFSTRWFDELAKTREEFELIIDDIAAESSWPSAQNILDRIVSWPTGDGV